MKKKIFYLLISILIMPVIFSFAAVCNGCNFPSIKNAANEPQMPAEEGDNEEVKEVVEEEELQEEEDAGINYKIAYFGVGINEDSSHFEHRVAEIYSVSPDGSGKELVYSDIDEHFDLSRIYYVSPDNSQISCGFYEGGRGAYSALAVLDVLTGNLTKLVEFDYTNDESQELLMDIYGNPVWMRDSRAITYEVISNPFTSNFRAAGIQLVNVETGETEEIEIEMEGLSERSTTFLYPVLFSRDNQKLYAICHTYFAKEEDGQVLDYISCNEKLMLIDIESGSMTEIISVDNFEQELATFDNFNLFTGEDKLVFHVLGDFEEDGDLWVCNSDGSNLGKLTSNPELREQQPSVFESPDIIGKVAYIGSLRYGTISSEIPSGDVYTINLDGSENKKLTDYGVGPAKPIFSPDGRYIAFIHHIYSENKEYIESKQIEVFDTATNQLTVAASGSNIFDLAGWIIGN